MPVGITVGPPVLSINQGSTFIVTDLNGFIAAGSDHGLFAGDTRFVSYYEIFANDVPWTRLTSSATAYYAERIYLTNPQFFTETGEIRGGSLGLVISRTVGEGVHEDLDITNYSLGSVQFNLEIAVRSDFADLFEVKSHRLVRRGRIETIWDKERGELRVSYANRDFRRGLIYRLLNNDSPPYYANGRITFEVELAPGASWHSCCFFMLVEGDRVRAPIYGCYDKRVETDLDRLQREWRDTVTQITSTNEDACRLYCQSVEDMGALRLYDQASGPHIWLAAAGVPWFVTIFGRDSLVVSLQNMMVDCTFACGALKVLAQYQATEKDDWRDAQPGKILHELRVGELAHFHKVPHSPYYGTADATILYLIAWHEAWKWMGDAALLHDYHDVALCCLDWIDRYGDLDGDGFQEYKTYSSNGYENMGWKDAGDAVVYPDGSQVKQPKALCELQGYTFDAWLRTAEIFDALGKPERARELRKKAAKLQARFEERFWCEDMGFYAFGLDPDKKPIRTIASNPGHCLWSGIASPERAARVVKRLFEPDMWSGWGIRTLSSRNPAYNPFSYQRGSVWPHDNGIIAMGFKRYGFANEAGRVAKDIVEASRCFASYRLPELYAGTERRPGAFPVQYLGANVPQAWAAGTIFHLLQAILGLQADAPNNRLYVDPQLPDWLPDLTLRGLRVGRDKLDLHFWRDGDQTRWDVIARRASVEVLQRAWEPWSVPG
ncbi:MAG: amylo-alpha-1,6-glucosidase [Chloroflexi bacterium]|nr:amylo-alpha-1,6-glucosidase [Chloroflexota bacterium]